jgi:alpha-galactosidase
MAAGVISLCCGTAMAKPLKVYILAGQSNMEGHAAVRTFDHIGMEPKTAPMLKDMRNADGTPRVCKDVDIAFFTSTGGWGKTPTPAYKQGKLTTDFGAQGREPKIGPEFTFGIYMQEHLNEPMLIIKTAWGGKSLNTDFRSPSGGPYQWNEKIASKVNAEKKEAKKAATGRYYREMIEDVRKVLADPGKVCPAYDKKEGYELAGFVWFQGFNDSIDSDTYPDRNRPGGYDLYSQLLCHFIRDVRKDLNAPKMPFVIGVMGIGGPVNEAKEAKKAPRLKGVTENFRKAMAAPAAMPEFKGNVTAVRTEKYWDPELDELVARSSKADAMAKKLKDEGKLSPAEQKAALAKFNAELFTPKEAEILAKGKSNKAYHYLGSSKIIAQIGKAFADAMAEFPGKQN